MNNRQRMWVSNAKARKFILNLGGTDVFFQRHTRRKYVFHSPGFSYTATDLFNLFDGLFFLAGKLFFFQVKTNAWPNEKRIKHFLSGKFGFGVLVINIRTKPRPEIKTRWY